MTKPQLKDFVATLAGLFLISIGHELARIEMWSLMFWLSFVPGCAGIALMRFGARQ